MWSFRKEIHKTSIIGGAGNAPMYNGNISIRPVRDCELSIGSFPISVAQDHSTNPYLITNYVGNSWKTLVITSIAYTKASELYLGTPIVILSQGDLPLNIDIEGQIVIPDLKLIFDNLVMDNALETITLTFSIIDINDEQGAEVTGVIELIKEECDPNPPAEGSPEITSLSYLSENECKSAMFTVTGEDSTTYKYEIMTMDDGNHSYDASLVNTDTMGSISPDNGGGTGNTVEGTFSTNGSGIINLKYEVCARPPISGSTNCVTVRFALFEEDNTTLNLAESFTINTCYS